ncbi:MULTISPECIES: hypothetical protein [Bacillus cereus group]|uniref:Uncharacterized protein n=1 Tax=Bacillus cereus TaxID=1396 RepID=A0A9W7QFF9_BACCE|nr:hypothetical protein [Bacillus cereus]KAB2395332.1 hypothetical protein F8172_14740 [Bacillus cereus]KAB2408086.1 hypothetical protein F8170_09740 [Bacillus cereus]KAB2430955.1 hypothetical protein F8168_06560 [Bacillus cereus]
MKKVLKSLTVTSLVLSGGFLFGFSEQASAASPQTSKSEFSTENRGIASYKFSFYDLSDLRGTEFFTLTPGSAKNFLGDDDISSIEMPPSSYIIIYSDLNYEGYERRIENRSETKYKKVNLENYYMGDTDKTWNNKVGSLKTGSL